MSSLRQNLQREGNERNIHFWFGSAIHFALEDYHGWNRFGDPRRAYKAYYEASQKTGDLPEGAEGMYPVGLGMLSYYLKWYPKHNQDYEFETVWLDKEGKEAEPFSEGAQPGTEIRFFLDLGIRVIVDRTTGQIGRKYTPELDPYLVAVHDLGETEKPAYYNYYSNDEAFPTEVLIVPIHYHGTVDKIVKDRKGKWWILDYKTAKSADTNKLDTDDQISAYIWALEQYMNHPIEGFVYLQLTKDVAKEPKRLKNGDLSTDKKQKTTHALLRKALTEEFGSIANAPNKYIEFLNHIAEQEFPEGDRFIRWDMVKRTKEEIVSTYHHIMGELEAMINPNLYLYPSPTRDCIWDCPIRELCLASDRDDKETVGLFMKDYIARPREEDGDQEKWKDHLVYPEEKLELGTEEEFMIDFNGEDTGADMNLIFGSDENEEG